MLYCFVIPLKRYKLYNDNTKPLPAMTLCPMAGFKQEGFFYKQEDVLNNTLDLGDIISNAMYNHTKSIKYEEPIAQQMGRCFSLKSNTGYELNDGLELHLKNNSDLKIYIHIKGDELWLTGFQEFPYEAVATVTIDLTRLQNFSLALLAIKESVTVRQSKPEIPCRDYAAVSGNDHEMFTNCCKKSLWKYISKDINCTIADMKPIIPLNSTIKECQDTYIAEKVYWTFNSLLEKFIPKPSEYDCPIPCKQTSYQVRLKYYHKNNARLPSDISNLSKGFLTLYVFYPTFDVEEKIESLECDLANLLVSAGGNLGLFLGFSCLTVMFSALEWIKAKFAKPHQV